MLTLTKRPVLGSGCGIRRAATALMRHCHGKRRGVVGCLMSPTYARHQFPPAVIQHAVWLYLRFTLSFRDVEDLLAERGIQVSYESVRRWVAKFGPLFARQLRHRRPRPSSRWHLDEMAVQIGGNRFWLWRAVDSEGEVLDVLIQPKRDRHGPEAHAQAAHQAGFRALGPGDRSACLVRMCPTRSRATSPPRPGPPSQ